MLRVRQFFLVVPKEVRLFLVGLVIGYKVSGNNPMTKGLVEATKQW